MRHRVYARKVASEDMTEATANWEIRQMEEVLEVLKEQRSPRLF